MLTVNRDIVEEVLNNEFDLEGINLEGIYLVELHKFTIVGYVVYSYHDSQLDEDIYMTVKATFDNDGMQLVSGVDGYDFIDEGGHDSLVECEQAINDKYPIAFEM